MRFLFSFIWLVFAVVPSGASENCTPHRYSGKWENVRQETKTISRLEIIDQCESDAPYGRIKIRGFETCYPRDCSWGWTGGLTAQEAGAQALSATFKTFIAERHVMLSSIGNRLRVVVEIDYFNPERENRRMAHVFHRIIRP